MPKEDGHGYSKYTAYKRWRFSEILGWHTAAAYNAADKAPAYKPRMYHYIDLTSGKGYTPKQQWEPGSPIVAAGILASQGKAYRIHLYEREPVNAESLAICLGGLRDRGIELNSSWINLHCMSYQAGLPVLIKEMQSNRNEARVGLIYYDPTTFGSESSVSEFIDLIDACGNREFKYIDVLLHVPVTTFKRIAKASHKPCLMRLIEAFPKNFKWISRPATMHQWTFFYLSNSEKILPPKLLQSIDSPSGSDRVRLVSNTKKELRDSDQMTMFGINVEDAPYD